MIVAVPKEILPGEQRVALIPDTVRKLCARRLEVIVEAGAGNASMYADAAYESAGARIEPSAEKLFSLADVILKVREPGKNPETGKNEVDLFKEGSVLISFLFPISHPDLVQQLVDRKVTSFAMELMPRITRAQTMDALSSMSSIAGYKAVLLAAGRLPKFFPMLMTAAGTITPARALILGAGVAGLQAIATAKRLGAVVEAYDIRPAVKEQVESLGGRFVELPVETKDAEDAGGYAREQSEEAQAKQRELLKEHVRKSDVVVTTALVPGKKAPVLVTEDMVQAMRPGSVIVDLAGEQGGNCELTKAGEDVVANGVLILSPLNLAGETAVHASQMYSRNISEYLFHLTDKEGQLHLDLEDELTRAPLVTRDGEILHEATKEAS